MARPKLGDGDTERLHMKLTADEREAIDDWRYTNRIPSRSEAVRRLCQIAMSGEPFAGELAEDGRNVLGSMHRLIEMAKRNDVPEDVRQEINTAFWEYVSLGHTITSMARKFNQITAAEDLDIYLEMIKVAKGLPPKPSSSE